MLKIGVFFVLAQEHQVDYVGIQLLSAQYSMAVWFTKVFLEGAHYLYFLMILFSSPQLMRAWV